MLGVFQMELVMPALELLRSQRNQAFVMIREAGLEPEDFQWFEAGDAVRLVHIPTDYYFDFDSDRGKWNVRHFPQDAIGIVAYYGIQEKWTDVLSIFENWIAIVQREHSAPDLWAISQEEKKLIAEHIDDLENSPFANDEKLRISTAINELKEFLVASGQHSDSQIQFITTRLQHLEEASHRLGRKDWITLTMGTLTNIVVGAALAPEAARELLRTAGALLGWVVGSVHLLP